MPRATSLVLLLAVCAAPAPSQSYSPLPGYNVGFSPRMLVYPGTFAGQPAAFLIVPGNEDIVTVHDVAFLPPGTIEVQLNVQLWAVYEPLSCGVGSGLFFDTQNALSTSPVETVSGTGFNVFTSLQTFGFSPPDPFFSDWRLSYCMPSRCTSPCGSSHVDPALEVYLVTANFR